MPAERNEQLRPGAAPPPAAKPIPETSRFKVHTPNEGFNGVRFNVRFQDGVGYTDSEDAAAACEAAGYRCEERRGRKKADDKE